MNVVCILCLICVLNELVTFHSELELLGNQTHSSTLKDKEQNTPYTFLCKERTFNRKIMLRNEAISNVRKCIQHFTSCDIQLDIHKVYS